MSDKSNTFESGNVSAEDVGETAAMWLARRDRGLSAAEEREFVAWRAVDARHDEEFSRLESEWQSFDLARVDPELAAMAQALDDQTRSRPAIRSRHAWAWGLGAAAAAAAAIAVMFLGNTSTKTTPKAIPVAATPSTYQVVPSASRQLALEDGSVVTLRGDSEISAEFTATERRVRLVRGEAHFAVAKNPERPFIVSAGGVAVRAVGTAFNVRIDPSTVEVLVTEGRVRVSEMERDESVIPLTEPSEPPVLSAGQRIVVNAASAPIVMAPIDAVTPVEIERELAWQSTRLIFDRTPLTEAIDAFNQHGKSRLVLGDAKLRRQLLGGTVRADNVDGFVSLLELSMDVRAERRDDGSIVLTSAR